MNASKTESSVGQGEKFREREEMGGAFMLDNIRQHLIYAKYRKKGSLEMGAAILVNWNVKS